MEKAVVVYSYTGKSLAYAKNLAGEENAALCTAEDTKRPNRLKAFTLGAFAAMRQKKWPIEPMDIDMGEYDEIILIAPIWAGCPAPEFNSILSLLPAGKRIRVRMLSASGKSDCKEKVKLLIEEKSCTMAEFQDIKA